jgi:hypothetical protein
MNRNLNGTPLTNEQLIEIARANGVTAKVLEGVNALHNTGLIRSKLIALTKGARFRMHAQGLLMLDTRTPANSPGYRHPVA